MSIVSLAERAVFAGRYRIARCIAAGGMGAVYEVIHLETERRRALKVMHPQFLQSQDLRDRFRQEARVAAHIESDFIVDVFDAGIDDVTQMPFLVMELLKGEELGKLLARRGRLTPAEVVTYLHQASLALDKTHSARIVHRDLKPENLFLTERDDGLPMVKILDFGIAKVVADSGTNVNATKSIGTPLYMAPEQFRPGHRVSPAADLYALSMIAYTLLVGRPYWAEEAAGGNVFTFAALAMFGPQEAASGRAHRAGVALPPAFDAWFTRAAALQPEARFGTATATVTALAEALGLPIPGVSASGSQGAVPALAHPLGAETRAVLSTSLSSVGASPSGPCPGLHGSSPGPHDWSPGAHGNKLGAQIAAPGTPVLVGIAAGVLLCLVGVGAAVYWLILAPVPSEPDAVASMPEPPLGVEPSPEVEPAPVPAAEAPPVVVPTPPPAAEATKAMPVTPKPTAAPVTKAKPAASPLSPPGTRGLHARD